jgi:hypothetical protein
MIVTTQQHKRASILKVPSTPGVEDLLPEDEIGLYLIEIYFVRFFSAGMIFDRQQLMEKYRAGRVPAHVLLSIFAVVSL